MNIANSYTCHTGGASGSDIIFERLSLSYGINVQSYSFYGHKSESSKDNIVILDDNQLNVGWEKVLKTNKRLNRNIGNLSPYVKKLLARDYYQSKNSIFIYAIGIFDKNRKFIDGGTAYACSMAIDSYKQVYFYEQNEKYWYYYEYNLNRFVKFYDIVKIFHNNFAGIGTRNINENGITAIKELFKNTFQ